MVLRSLARACLLASASTAQAARFDADQATQAVSQRPRPIVQAMANQVKLRCSNNIYYTGQAFIGSEQE